jgi:siroheme synthase-like protein
MDYLPIAIRLKNRKAIVVGGGIVAERKIETLLLSGVDLTVISPSLTAKLVKAFKLSRFRWLKRKIQQADVAGVDMVVAATNDKSVNENVSEWAGHSKILVNVVDKPKISDFISPALLEKEEALVAVYTDGKNPVLSRDLKNYLGEKWDDFLLYRDRL